MNQIYGPASDSSEKNIERNTDPVGFAGGAPNHDYYTDARHRQSEDDFQFKANGRPALSQVWGPASDSSEKNIERNTDPVGFAGGAPNHDYYTDARHRQSEDDF